jgi:tripartite-type tricarboxylate transporter receptor subunit TctC
MDAWYAMLVPSSTPKELVTLLNRHVVQGLKAPDVQERLASLGVEAVADTPEQAAKYIASEERKWGKVLKAANIKAD